MLVSYAFPLDQSAKDILYNRLLSNGLPKTLALVGRLEARPCSNERSGSYYVLDMQEENEYSVMGLEPRNLWHA